MDLIKCPRCGEEFSPSYRKCPFCEEGDHPRKVKYNGGKSGRRVSGKKQTYSARGAMACVLVLVLVLLGWSLFGDNIAAHLSSARQDSQQGEQVDPSGDGAIEPNGGDTIDPNGDGAAEPNSGDTVDPSGDDVTDPDGGTAPDITGNEPQPEPVETTPVVDASALGIRTNVGTTLKRDASGRFDCTIGKSESIRLSITGTDAAVTWTSADTNVLTISADGTISPVSSGTTTVTATVGGASVVCTIRIR